MNALKMQNGNAGFTIIELMVVIVIVGIVAGITIPSFTGYLRQQRVQGASNELAADIQWTRSIAISRQATFQITFATGEYKIVQTGPNTVLRTRTAPDGVSYTADTDPNFYSWGLSDAAAISISGGSQTVAMSLLPNGTVSHGAQ